MTQDDSDEKILEDLGEVYTPLAFDNTNPAHVELIQKLIPDMRPLESCINPLTKVWFRMGLLVMREVIKHDIRKSHRTPVMDATTAWQIADSAWPEEQLGSDPGTPRKIHWDELTVATRWLSQEDADTMNAQSNAEHDTMEDREPYKAGEPCGWDTNPNFTASLEALPEALRYLQMMGVMKYGD